MRALCLVLMCCWQGCFWGPGQLPTPLPQGQIEAALRPLVPAGQGLVLAGVRDGQGKRTALTRVLDEQLAGALVRLGADFAVAEGDEDWDPAVGVPPRYWEGQEPLLLTGQAQPDSTALYLRLQVLSRAGQHVVAAQTLRLPVGALEARVAATPGAATAAALQLQVQVLALHEEGGFEAQVALADGGRLRAGDRLKLRLRAGSDCQVHAWLYSTAGQAQDLFASQQMYKGQLQETDWLTVDQANLVQTLYVVAGEHLDEDKSELFASLAELLRLGQVQQFTGLEKVDQVVGQYLARQVTGRAAVPVQRQSPPLGAEEKIILGNGTVLKSRPWLLKGAGVLVQALSFEVP